MTHKKKRWENKGMSFKYDFKKKNQNTLFGGKENLSPSLTYQLIGTRN